MACLSCGRGFFDECDCEPETGTVITESKPIREDISVSAARKRAARDYPIDPAKACEWRMLANVGGGSKPIIGCINGIQQARHHGPFKIPTDGSLVPESINDKNNLWLICHGCHNRWHTANDSIYDQELYRTLPHSPREITPDEILEAGVNETKPTGKTGRSYD